MSENTTSNSRQLGKMLCMILVSSKVGICIVRQKHIHLLYFRDTPND